MVFSKLAQSVDMALDVPSSEEKIAQKTIRYFNMLIKKITAFDRHLDILYNPLKSHENVSEKSVIDHRAAIHRYRDKIKENFEEIKNIAIHCLQSFNYFSTDTHISELIRTFNDSFDDVENSLTILLQALDNWQDKEYRAHVMQSIENTKKQAIQVKKLIEDRIIDYINTNIYAKNWTDNLDDELKMSIKEREPYIKQLYKERESKLKEILDLK